MRQVLTYIVGLFLPVDVPDELRLSGVGRPFAVAAIAMITTALVGIVVISQLDSFHRDLPTWWPLALAVSFYLGEAVSTQRRGKAVTVNFAQLFVLTSIGAFGLHWQLLVAVAVARGLAGLRTLPMSGGYVGWAGNIGLIVLESSIGGLAFWAIQPHVSMPIAIAGLMFMHFLSNVLLLSAWGAMGGMKWSDFFKDLVTNEGKYLAFNLPFAIVVVAVMDVNLVYCYVALFAIVYMGDISFRSSEQLLVAEFHLGLDALTGLCNRNRLMYELAEITAAADANEKFTGVIMIDIDNFKSLNDTYGHMQGDRAIINVAKTLGDIVRETDTAARYGGEEFTLILENVTQKSAMEIAERTREAVKVALAEWDRTISLGLMVRPPGGATGKEVLDLADRALYSAKFSGKNCTVEFDESMIADAKPASTEAA